MRWQPSKATLAQTWSQCGFRSFIESPGGPVRHAFAALGGTSSTIDPALLQEMVQAIQGGGRVLVMSDRADLRDRAKAEIMGMLVTPAGQATEAATLPDHDPAPTIRGDRSGPILQVRPHLRPVVRHQVCALFSRVGGAFPGRAEEMPLDIAAGALIAGEA